MPASEARILANQQNALRSTGPKTAEGKERSRANAYKHGMTGAGVVLPEADAAEVERRAVAFAAETNASGEIGRVLARAAALNSVRMERGADQQTAALSEHVRQVEAEFVAPEGTDPAEADRLRSEAVRRAMFDPSKEAALARKYEAAAERGFFRALKELQRLQKQARAARPGVDEAALQKTLASFSRLDREFDQFAAKYPETAPIPPTRTPARSVPAYLPPIDGAFDVPITIGRRR